MFYFSGQNISFQLENLPSSSENHSCERNFVLKMTKEIVLIDYYPIGYTNNLKYLQLLRFNQFRSFFKIKRCTSKTNGS